MKGPDVSDHAVIRYLERVHQIEMDALRAHIALVCQRGHSLGANVVKVEGLEYIIENGVVVTVCIAGRPDRPRVRARRRQRDDE